MHGGASLMHLCTTALNLVKELVAMIVIYFMSSSSSSRHTIKKSKY